MLHIGYRPLIWPRLHCAWSLTTEPNKGQYNRSFTSSAYCRFLSPMPAPLKQKHIAVIALKLINSFRNNMCSRAGNKSLWDSLFPRYRIEALTPYQVLITVIWNYRVEWIISPGIRGSLRRYISVCTAIRRGSLRFYNCGVFYGWEVQHLAILFPLPLSERYKDGTNKIAFFVCLFGNSNILVYNNNFCVLGIHANSTVTYIVYSLTHEFVLLL